MLKSLEKKCKKLLSGLVKMLLDEGAPPEKIPSPGDLKNVLVIRHDNKIGNLLLITPFLSELRKAFPDSSISILVSEAYPEIFEENDDIDHVILYHKSNLKRYPWKAFGLYRLLRGAHYDLAIDASHPHSFSFTSAILTRLSGAPNRLGFDRGDARYYINLPVPMPAERQHESDIILSLLYHLGTSPVSGPLKYTVRKDELAWADIEQSRLGCKADEPVIGIFAGGRGSKKIAFEVYADIARILEDNDPGTIVFFLGPLEQGERALFREIVGEDRTIAPQYPLRKFAALLTSLSVFVTPDSGPMHLAGALDVPVVAIFREDRAWRYGPRAAHDTVLFYPEEINSREVCSTIIRTLQGHRKARSDEALHGS